MTHLLKPNDNGLASLDEVRAWMEAQESAPTIEQDDAAIDTHSGFIRYENGKFIMRDIEVKHRTYDVMMHSALIGTLQEKTLAEWHAQPEARTIDGTTYDVASLYEIIAITRALYCQRNIVDAEQKGHIEQLRDYLRLSLIHKEGVLLDTMAACIFHPDVLIRNAITREGKRMTLDDTVVVQDTFSLVGDDLAYNRPLYGNEDAASVDDALRWLHALHGDVTDRSLIAFDKIDIRYCAIKRRTIPNHLATHRTNIAFTVPTDSKRGIYGVKMIEKS